MTARLGDDDRRRIDEARSLAACKSADELREHLTGRGLIEPGEFEGREVAPFALGVARVLLGDLAGLAERLGGDEGQAAEDAGRLDEIRAILTAFDWEHDDRQYALERIEMIVAVDDDQADEPEDDYNYTCSTCGAQIGMFIGGQGWEHYRGSGTAADRIEIYDAGHEATFADGTP